MEWFHRLPVKLQRSAYQSGEEHAWNRTEALEVISWLQEHGFMILGVDVWLPTTPGPAIPTPYVHDWDRDAATSSPDAAQNALDFVDRFEWHDEDGSKGKVPCFAMGPVELKI